MRRRLGLSSVTSNFSGAPSSSCRPPEESVVLHSSRFLPLPYLPVTSTAAASGASAGAATGAGGGGGAGANGSSATILTGGGLVPDGAGATGFAGGADATGFAGG